MRLSAWYVTAVVAALLLLSAQSPAQGRLRRGRTIQQDLGADHFATGPNVEVTTPVVGDLIACGGMLGLDSNVTGDTTTAGGTIRLNGAYARNVYAAGGQVYLNGTVSGNARIAGGNVDLAPGARVDGNLSAAAGEVRIDGAIGGYLQAAGGTVYINGPVGGDVEATGRSVELGPNARIAGRLVYRSRQDLAQDPAAQVARGIERRPFEAAPRRAFRALAITIFVAWMLGFVLISIVLLLLFPGFIGHAAEQVRRRAGISALLGFAIFVCGPTAAFILLFTLIGIPLSLLTMAAYFVLWGAGYVAAATALGGAILGRSHAGPSASFGWRFAAAVMGILILALFGIIPLLGGLIVFIALVMGMGAIVLQLHHRLSPTPTP